MGKFRCKRCNYLFGTEIKVKLCPNCGNEYSIEEEKNADDLLKLVE